MINKVLVFGGTGYLGSHIMKHSTPQLQAFALSRSAKPSANVAQGNALEPSTYSANLIQNESFTTHAICSVGVLMNGMGGQTFEQANYSTALISAKALSDSAKVFNKRPCFVYISAANSPPWPFPAGYMESKRRAEADLFAMKESLRVVVLRPGMIYSYDQRQFILPAAFGSYLLSSLISPFKSIVPGSFKFLLDSPLNADVIAKAALNACLDEAAEGIYEINGIERLASRTNK